MTQKYRFTLPFVVAVAIAIAAAPVFAGGGAESVADSGGGGTSKTARAPFTGTSSLDEAIQAAAAVPASWDYDPGARFIYHEGDSIPYPINLDETLWLSRLDDFEYYVLRGKGTEYAFSNPMHASKERGTYYSRATGQPLFSSADKYDSGTGWPSFTRPINPDAIVYIGDTTLFAPRIEVVDSLSGSHLGHVFPDGPAPTGQRYCINAASLVFVPDGEAPPPLLEELRLLATTAGQ
jgi:peptide-methionine (R)-S-oxide reductase